jgi:hypothetical protein
VRRTLAAAGEADDAIAPEPTKPHIKHRQPPADAEAEAAIKLSQREKKRRKRERK